MIPAWDHVLIGDEIPLEAADDGARCSQRLSLPAVAQAARLARRATSEALLSWGLGQLQEKAVLVVSELVANAVLHARAGSTAITLRLEVAQPTLRIEVTDADPRWPRPRRPAGLDESGFGFVLVQALVRDWGLRDTAAGKVVWAELDTRLGAEPQA